MTAKTFRFGWYGDGGLGERMIRTVLAGRKTASASPAYDPEDADIVKGDELDLVDKAGASRGKLLVTRVELKPLGEFDEELAGKIGVSLADLREKLNFANGRWIRDDEDMRVIHFRLMGGGA